MKKTIRFSFLLSLCLKRNIKIFPFSGFASFLLKYKKFLKLKALNFHFLNYKKLLRVFFFIFSSSESYFLNYKKNTRLENSISGNIRKFRFPKYKKM